jgi:hypothetical protein
MGGCNETSIAQSFKPPKEMKCPLHVGHTVVDTGDKMGVKICLEGESKVSVTWGELRKGLRSGFFPAEEAADHFSSP